MKKNKQEMSLVDLPDDMLGAILGKVGESSFKDFTGCLISCKTFQRISKYPEVLQRLDLTQVFSPPWERIPENSQIIYDCAESGNVHAIFLCGLIEYYFTKPRVTGTNNLKMAADVGHCEGMYLYGMALINDNQLTEGSYYIKKLWTEQGFEAIWQCLQNCSRVVLEMSMRDYRGYELLLSQIEAGDESVLAQINEVCDGYFIYKEISCFIDHIHFV